MSVERLREIKGQLKDLVNEARDIIRRDAEPITWERAKSYCLAQLAIAIDEDHDYLSDVMFDLASIIEEMSGGDENEVRKWMEDNFEKHVLKVEDLDNFVDTTIKQFDLDESDDHDWIYGLAVEIDTAKAA